MCFPINHHYSIILILILKLTFHDQSCFNCKLLLPKIKAVADRCKRPIHKNGLSCKNGELIPKIKAILSVCARYPCHNLCHWNWYKKNKGLPTSSCRSLLMNYTHPKFDCFGTLIFSSKPQMSSCIFNLVFIWRSLSLVVKTSFSNILIQKFPEYTKSSLEFLHYI